MPRADPQARAAKLADGGELAYDHLLVAVGAHQRAPLQHALTFGGPQSVEAFHGLVQDVEGGYLKRVAFVIPSKAVWPLPVYELALMTAERAHSMWVEDIELALVTIEEHPLEIFGGRALEKIAPGAGLQQRLHIGPVFMDREGQQLHGRAGFSQASRDIETVEIGQRDVEQDDIERVDVEEGRIFTLHLRPGHKWSDGHPFTSEDFRYWFEDVASNKDLSMNGLPIVLMPHGEPPRFEVLDRETVRQAFAARGVVALKGDWTSENPEITRLLQRFGRSGVPLYLFYDGKSGPVVLPQILTEAAILDVVAKS